MKYLFVIFAVFLLGSPSSQAALSPRQLEAATLSPTPGTALPLKTEFEAAGSRIILEDAIGGRPAVLLLADYTCRFICGTTLAIAADGLARTGLIPGRDYSFIVIGIDPRDRSSDAEAMKLRYLAPFASIEKSASFLSGDGAATASITKALGYRPIYDAEWDQFAHPVGVVILTGAGRVSRVIGGLDLNPEALKAALLEARQGRLAALIEGIRLLCYGHAPLHGAYSSAVQTALVAFGLLTLAAIGAALAYLSRNKGLWK